MITILGWIAIGIACIIVLTALPIWVVLMVSLYKEMYREWKSRRKIEPNE